MNSAKEKFAGMRWLFIKPGKFFEDVARRGKYIDCLVFLAVLATWMTAGVILLDQSNWTPRWPRDLVQVSGLMFIGFVVITFFWGVFAALIGLRLRPRIAAVLTFKEALPRCLRVGAFSLAPLSLLFFHHQLLAGLALIGVFALSVIGVAKALSMKILRAFILQAIVCGSMVGGGALAVSSFITELHKNGGMASYPAKKLVGKPAPNILIQPTGGTPLHLADLKGKNVVIIDFWATWCPPCRAGLPMVSEVASKYKDRGVVFYAIGDGSINQEKVFLEQHKVETIASSSDSNGFEAFMVSAIPETVVVDKDGIIRSVHIGLSRNEKEELTSEIEDSLKEKSAPSTAASSPQ